MFLSLLTLVALASEDLHAPGQFVAGEGHLILTHTDVHAKVMADLAVVDLTQTFTNPFDHAVDATYVFPLPVEAGVRDMTVTCGERVIRSEILTKDAARKRYDEARSQGRRAALLEQQTANVFTQHVGGLCPGETVTVTLQYVEALSVVDGVHTFAFPTTMGPRYAPGDLEEPPLVPHRRSGRDLSLRLEVDAGVALQSIWSDTFPIAVLGEDDEGADIELLEADTLPNRDLHVAWTLATDVPQVSALAATDRRGERFVSLSVVPPAAEHATDPRPRELVFVLDSSCSMRGEPWQAAVDTVELALQRMRPEESFNLVRFSDAAGAAFPEPVPATPANVATATAWMQRFEGGGTAMSAGLVEALDQPGDPEALRMVLLLTDGYIGDERSFFGIARDHLRDNDRIFGLGIGSSVNRLLLDGLAHHGRGAAAYQLPGTPLDETVRQFYSRIDRPVLTDIEVDWGTLRPQGDTLEAPADLFAGQPLHLVAKVDGADHGVVTVRGLLAGQPYRTSVVVDLAEAPQHEAVPTLWARRQIQAIDRDLDEPLQARQEAVTGLALNHRLVSAYTSLVAVDDQVGACGASDTVDVPQLLPDGLDPAMAARSSGMLGALQGTGGLGTRGTGHGGGAVGSIGGLGSGKSGYGGGGGTFGAKGRSSSTVKGEAAVVMGSLDKSLIQKVIQRHIGQIRYCYERELAKDPTLAGRLAVHFRVGADGKVVMAEITDASTLASEPMRQCVLGRVKRMTFPAPRATIEVTYPFVFSPQ